MILIKKAASLLTYQKNKSNKHKLTEFKDIIFIKRILLKY